MPPAGSCAVARTNSKRDDGSSAAGLERENPCKMVDSCGFHPATLDAIVQGIEAFLHLQPSRLDGLGIRAFRRRDGLPIGADESPKWLRDGHLVPAPGEPPARLRHDGVRYDGDARSCGQQGDARLGDTARPFGTVQRKSNSRNMLNGLGHTYQGLGTPPAGGTSMCVQSERHAHPCRDFSVKAPAY